MIDDMELAEKLKYLYGRTGIDMLGTEEKTKLIVGDNDNFEESGEAVKTELDDAEEDDSSPERVEEKNVVSEHAPMPTQERYRIMMGVEVSVDYENRWLDVINRGDIARIPFGAIPSLMHFLGWLIDSKKIDEE